MNELQDLLSILNKKHLEATTELQSRACLLDMFTLRQGAEVVAMRSHRNAICDIMRKIILEGPKPSLQKELVAEESRLKL